MEASSRLDAESRDLPATAGDVGQAGGAEAGEEAADFAAEKIGGEIDEHVAIVDCAVGPHPRKNFAADGDALLHDPAALRGGDSFFDNRVPFGFAGSPAERD